MLYDAEPKGLRYGNIFRTDGTAHLGESKKPEPHHLFNYKTGLFTHLFQSLKACLGGPLSLAIRRLAESC